MFNIEKNNKNKKLFCPDPDEFISKYQELGSSLKVAKYYGVESWRILRYAHSLGYDTSYKPKITEGQKQEIISRYNTISASKLAKEYGISTSYVSIIWKKAGLIGKQNRPYSLNENYFSTIDSNDKAYFLGLIGSDGCIFHPKTDKQDIIRICLRYEDVKVLELFKDAIKTDKPITTSRDIYKVFEISSNKMVEDIKKLGISYRKTWDNTIADVERKYIPHLIRGYIDGDGCITKCANTDNDINISISGYESNMIKIQDYLTSRFIFTSFIIDNRGNTTFETGKFGQLVVSNKTAKYSLLKLIYADCDNYYMNRKYNAAMDFINFIENSDKSRDKQIVLYYKYAVCATC